MKNDNYKFENKVGKSYCDLCCRMAIEDAEYILMHCPTLDDTMNQMSQKINDLEMSTNTLILSDGRETLATLMDNVSNDKQSDVCVEYLKVACILETFSNTCF